MKKCVLSSYHYEEKQDLQCFMLEKINKQRSLDVQDNGNPPEPGFFLFLLFTVKLGLGEDSLGFVNFLNVTTRQRKIKLKTHKNAQMLQWENEVLLSDHPDHLRPLLPPAASEENK